jgi:predicted oxidoreductase
MKSITLGTSTLSASRLAYGCWRIAASKDDASRGRQAVLTAYETGYTLFDHADIYCGGEAERLFGRVLAEVPAMRERILIASKCGIRKPGDPEAAAPYRYDFSATYIIRSCEESLQRLGIDTLDLYQLHRPDYLMEPAEIADAFSRLRQAGKVREFGVSNFRHSQLQTLQQACPMPLIANQVEISLANLTCFDDGTLDHCLANHVLPMAWSPLAGGKLADGPRQVLPAQESYQTTEINNVLDELARRHQASRPAVALAWLLRHPSKIMPIVGSTAPASIRAAAQADELEISREEWYQLLRTALGRPLP